MLYLVALAQYIVLALDVLDADEKNNQIMQNLNNSRLTLIFIILSIICEIAVEVLDSEGDDQIHNLIQCLRDYK